MKKNGRIYLNNNKKGSRGLPEKTKFYLSGYPRLSTLILGGILFENLI